MSPHPLADDRADGADRRSVLDPCENERQRGGKSYLGEELPLGRAEGTHQVDGIHLHRGQAGDRVHAHRKEADQGDDDHLGGDPESEPEDQDWRNRDHGNRLRADDDRQQRLAQKPRVEDHGAEEEAGRHPQAESEQHLDQRHPRVGEEAIGGVLDARLDDSVQGRQDVLRLAGHDDEQLPHRDDQPQRHDRRDRVSQALRHEHPSARAAHVGRAPARVGCRRTFRVHVDRPLLPDAVSWRLSSEFPPPRRPRSSFRARRARRFR